MFWLRGYFISFHTPRNLELTGDMVPRFAELVESKVAPVRDAAARALAVRGVCMPPRVYRERIHEPNASGVVLRDSA